MVEPATLIDQASQLITANPNKTLLSGLALSAAIIIADFETGVSIKLPSRKRLGLAGIIAGGSAVLWYLATSGVTGLLGEVASGLVVALIAGPLLSWYLNNSN